MNFTSPNLNDVESYKRFFGLDDNMSYENAFATLFIWDELLNYKIYFEDDFLILGFYDNCFYLPFGNFEKGMKALMNYVKEKNIIPTLITSECEKLEKFKKLYSDKVTIRETRDFFEYIYLATDLAELKGKKYHSKRNHIKNFQKLYEYSLEELNENNKYEFLKTAKLWFEASEKTEETSVELNGIKKLLENINIINVLGAAIKVNGEIAAFSLATKINDETVNIHIEKALPEYRGAYSVINQEFAKILSKDFKYINREDDVGIEGLRKAKLSYKPTILLKKYEITFNE